MDESQCELDHRLAFKLKAVLLDDELWTLVETPYGDGWSREAMAYRALALYDFTAPLTEIRLEDLAQPFHYAIGALRDAADACAILSRRWNDVDLASLAIPKRSELEAAIALRGVPKWAASVGVELQVPQIAPPLAPGGKRRNEPRDNSSAEELAESWSGLMNAFQQRVADRALYPRDVAIRGDAARDLASELVAACRVSLIAAQRSAREEIAGVGLTQLFAAQGMFISSWEEDERSGMFPSDELLRRTLDVTGGIDWLRDHGAEIPPELLG